MSTEHAYEEATLSQTTTEPERLIFERNPLQTVVVQVRFPVIYALEQPAGVAAFQASIRDVYPRAEPRVQQVNVVLGPGGIGAQGGPQLGPWRFLNDDGTWVAGLAPDFVSLETTSYERFERFIERAERLLLASEETLGLTHRGRVGLRYINQFQHPEVTTVSDWRRFLEDHLLGAVAGELLRDNVLQALEQIELEFDPGRMTIRHGFVRPEETSSLYILDLDAYDDSSEPWNTSAIVSKLWDFKRLVWKIFRESITPELVEYLGPRSLDA